MKKTALLRALCLLVSITFLFACKKDISQSDGIDATSLQNSALSYIKSLGFKDTDIREVGNKYIVSGDIVFFKDSTYLIKERSKPGSKQPNQYGTGSYVTKSILKVRIDASMSGYVSHVNAAMAQWNNANGRLKFVAWDGNGGYDIHLRRNDDIGPGVCGQAPYPVNGNAGSFVEISIATLVANYNNFDAIKRTICHELGHTIGFVHSNEPNAPEAHHIPNTTTYSYFAESLMNGGECGIGAHELQQNDLIAFQYMYPTTTFFINGPAYTCSTATYNISNFPAGATVTWSASWPLAISGSPNAYPVTVVKTADGYGTLSATITTVHGQTYNVGPIDIIVGAASYIPHELYAVAGETNAITNAYPLYTYHMPDLPGAISYSWDVSGGTIPATIYNNNTSHPWVDVKFNSPGYHSIYVNVTTECGLVSLDGQRLEVLVTSGY